MTLALEDPGREAAIRASILGKPALKDWYVGIYERWAEALKTVPEGGLVVELGAGAGFAERTVPGLLRTDTIAYPGVDQVADALAMPWADGEVRAIFLLNVMHHLPDAEKFLSEAQRVLKPGGLLLITDPHIGILSRWIYGWGHHEPLDPAAPEWKFPVAHALSGANIALTWIVFQRDLKVFEKGFPELKMGAYERFAPLQYWLSGGLTRWNLVPSWGVKAVRAMDRLIIKVWPDTASFCHVVLRRA